LIRKEGELYTAMVTPPEGRGIPWSSPTPMTADELIDALLERGCHQTDIGDAFYEADPDWVERPDPNTT
jgi:hypothetical protein